MLQRVVFGMLGMVAMGLSVPALGGAQENVEVVGIAIAKKDPDSQFNQSFVPGTQSGVQVYLRVALPDKLILKVDGESTSLKITDSNNQELTANENADISFFASISDDKHSVILPVSSGDVPSSGATHLTVQGEATLNCGADSKTETINVTIAADTELKLGPVTAKILQIDEGFQENTKRIELESKTSFDVIESLAFLDKSGKEMASSPQGGGSFGFGGDMTYTKSIQIEGDPELVAQIKIVYFQKVEPIKVAVDAKVGLDLGK